MAYWGLVQQRGPWRETRSDLKHLKDVSPVWKGGGVPAGGLPHAGHGNWLQSMGPLDQAGPYPYPPLPKPSSWAVRTPLITRGVAPPGHRRGRGRGIPIPSAGGSAGGNAGGQVPGHGPPPEEKPNTYTSNTNPPPPSVPVNPADLPLPPSPGPPSAGSTAYHAVHRINTGLNGAPTSRTELATDMFVEEAMKEGNLENAANGVAEMGIDTALSELRHSVTKGSPATEGESPDNITHLPEGPNSLVAKLQNESNEKSLQISNLRVLVDTAHALTVANAKTAEDALTVAKKAEVEIESLHAHIRRRSADAAAAMGTLNAEHAMEIATLRSQLNEALGALASARTQLGEAHAANTSLQQYAKFASESAATANATAEEINRASFTFNLQREAQYGVALQQLYQRINELQSQIAAGVVDKGMGIKKEIARLKAHQIMMNRDDPEQAVAVAKLAQLYTQLGDLPSEATSSARAGLSTIFAPVANAAANSPSAAAVRKSTTNLMSATIDKIDGAFSNAGAVYIDPANKTGRRDELQAEFEKIGSAYLDADDPQYGAFVSQLVQFLQTHNLPAIPRPEHIQLVKSATTAAEAHALRNNITDSTDFTNSQLMLYELQKGAAVALAVNPDTANRVPTGTEIVAPARTSQPGGSSKPRHGFNGIPMAPSLPPLVSPAERKRRLSQVGRNYNLEMYLKEHPGLTAPKIVKSTKPFGNKGPKDIPNSAMGFVDAAIAYDEEDIANRRPLRRRKE